MVGYQLAVRIVFIALVVVVTALNCAGQQQEKRRPGADTFWGPVHTVRVERAEITSRHGQLIEGPRTLLQTISYNEDGTRRDLTIHRRDGAISDKLVETYEPDGRILEAEAFRGNGDPVNRRVLSYDDKKRLANQITYRADGSIFSQTTYAYQDNQRTHKSVAYDQNGVIVSEASGSLDLKKHRAETITRNPAQVVRREIAFTKTPDGQVYEERVNGEPSRRSFNRSLPAGRSELIQYDPDGAVKSRQRGKSEVDSNGNFVKWVRLVSKGDAADFQPIDVTYRTIEYYGKH